MKLIALATASVLLSTSVRAADPPCDRPCLEGFVRNGKLLRIEALVLPVTYGMPTGWGGKPSTKE
jgi:hypothetical protein